MSAACAKGGVWGRTTATAPAQTARGGAATDSTRQLLLRKVPTVAEGGCESSESNITKWAGWVRVKQLQDSFGGGCLQRTPKVVCCALLCALQEAKQADKAAKQEAARRRRAMRWVLGGCIRVASG